MRLEEYNELLELIRVKSPNHPLYAELSEGYSDANAIYIEHVVKTLDNDTTPVKVVALPEEKYEKEESTDDILKSLHIQKKSLFDQRRKLSNQFHECVSDTQRRAVSINIQYTQNKIEAVMQKLKSWEETGELPKQEFAPEMEYKSMNLFELSKKLLSIRAMLSRDKAFAKKLLELEDGPKKDDKITKLNTRIRESEILKLTLEKRIQAVNKGDKPG